MMIDNNFNDKNYAKERHTEDNAFDSDSEYEHFDSKTLLQKQINSIVLRQYYECNCCYTVLT